MGCELWNAATGVRSCYAGNIHTRFSPSKAYPGPFEQISLHPGRMAQAAKWGDLTGKDRPDKPWLNGLPRVIFVGDMGDLFSEDVPFNYVRDEVFAAIRSPQGRRHIWMVLTKQPKRFADFARSSIADWPPNLVSGTSVTTQATTSRIKHLIDVPGWRFVSAEPMREEIDLTRCARVGGYGSSWIDALNGRYYSITPGTTGDPWRPCENVHLVIVGGESNQGSEKAHPFDLNWASKLAIECEMAGISYFLKQVGSRPYIGDGRGAYDDHTYYKVRDGHGGDWSEWPQSIRIRQFPAIA